MGERKPLVKYYPPDFDPAKLPRMPRKKDEQVKVMMMLPMSVRCATCGAYIFKGKKLNARKETVRGETYLGIKIYRFYMRCDKCAAEFTIRTDPAHSDYACEAGAHRTFERSRADAVAEDAAAAQRADDDRDAMRALEHRTEEGREALDAADAVDELRELSARNARVDAAEAVLARRAARDENDAMRQKAQDDAEIAAARAEAAARRRAADDDEEEEEKLAAVPTAVVAANARRENGDGVNDDEGDAGGPRFVVVAEEEEAEVEKKRARIEDPSSAAQPPPSKVRETTAASAPEAPAGPALSLLGDAYNSDESSSC